MVKTFENWYQDHKETILETFRAYLKYPSISADPKYFQDLLACSQFVKDRLETIGFRTEVWETKAAPAIFGEIIHDPKYPTILFYCHYDVQPVDPLELWDHPPFEPHFEGDTVYARGASDDKGLGLYTMFGIEAFLQTCQNPKVNIKIIIEGEEEVGSEHFTHILEDKKEKLQADYLGIVDVPVPSLDLPTIALGCRGIVTFQVECSAADIDMHSGAFGGLAYNPLRALSELLSSCVDQDGKVAIEGFYDGIESLDPALFVDFDLSSKFDEVGLKACHKEKGYTLLETNTIRPTFEINGLWGGYIDEGFKTVIPSKAYCKLSCRLVPGQDSEKIGHLVADFLKKNIKEGMTITVDIGHGGNSSCASPESKGLKQFQKATGEVLGKPCGFTFVGGSVPVSIELQRVSGAETFFLGLALTSDQVHAPNEHFCMKRFKLGVLSIARALELLSSEGKEKDD